jgi:uncharacterized protein with HEPN domain
VSQRQLRHLEYVAQMLEAIVQAKGYLKGFDKQDFLADPKTQDAVMLKLLILGEAAVRTTTEAPEFVSLHSDIPWKEMRGMRNRMAHGYFDVDLEIVWDTLQNSLPDLEPKLRRILGAEPTSRES